LVAVPGLQRESTATNGWFLEVQLQFHGLDFSSPLTAAVNDEIGGDK